MGSHLCKVIGIIHVRSDVTEDEVRDTLRTFLGHHELDYDQEVARGNIALRGGLLHLVLDCHLFPNQDQSVLALCDMLGTVANDYDYLERLDFSSNNSDDACVPYFVGLTPTARDNARLAYGIDQMAPWVEPLVGKGAFDTIVRLLHELPIVPAPYRAAHS